jgi:hypothetical protein
MDLGVYILSFSRRLCCVGCPDGRPDFSWLMAVIEKFDGVGPGGIVSLNGYEVGFLKGPINDPQIQKRYL